MLQVKCLNRFAADLLVNETKLRSNGPVCRQIDLRLYMRRTALRIERCTMLARFCNRVPQTEIDIRIVAIATSKGQKPRRLSAEVKSATGAYVVLLIERVASVAIDYRRPLRIRHLEVTLYGSTKAPVRFWRVRNDRNTDYGPIHDLVQSAGFRFLFRFFTPHQTKREGAQ